VLKIRIVGTENELRQISHKIGNTQIQRFKRATGKTIFAIDVQISVIDFINNLDLSKIRKDLSNQVHRGEKKVKKGHCDPQKIQAQLQVILNQLNE
jgi:hypothetical protein